MVIDFGGIFCLNVYKKFIFLYVCLKSLSYRLWIFESFDGLIMLIWGFMRVFIGVDIFYSNCSFVCFYCFILFIIILIWGCLCFDEICCLFGFEWFYGLMKIYCWFGFECVYCFDDIDMYCGFWFGCVYGLIDSIVIVGWFGFECIYGVMIFMLGLDLNWVFLWYDDFYCLFGFRSIYCLIIFIVSLDLSGFFVCWY